MVFFVPMQTSRFDFELPPERIALRPAEPRGHARLMVVHGDGRVEHRLFHEWPRLLTPPDTLVFNDSRVILARLTGQRSTRGPQSDLVTVGHWYSLP